MGVRMRESRGGLKADFEDLEGVTDENTDCARGERVSAGSRDGQRGVEGEKGGKPKRQ
jgi:hypothetical protein